MVRRCFVVLLSSAFIQPVCADESAAGEMLVIDTRDGVACEHARERFIDGSKVVEPRAAAALDALCAYDEALPFAVIVRGDKGLKELAAAPRARSTFRVSPQAWVGATEKIDARTSRDFIFAKQPKEKVADSLEFSAAMSRFHFQQAPQARRRARGNEPLFDKVERVITPGIGPVLTSAFRKAANQIEQGGGTVMGSDGIGGAFLFVMNPAGGIASGLENIMGVRVFESAETVLHTNREKMAAYETDLGDSAASFIGIEMKFHFRR